MKLKTISSILAVAGIAIAGSNFKLNPSNPPTQRTGAPGETTCQTSGCHSGGTYKGTVTLPGLPDSVEANATYTLTLHTKSTGAVRNGFQMTCLTSTKAACGTFINVSGTNTATASLKQYIRQSNYKKFAGDTAVWTMKWKAPAVKNDSSFFYFSSLLANGNGGDSGDNCLAGKKRIYFKNTSTATAEPVDNSDLVSIKSNVVSEMLDVQLKEISGELSIFNLQGQIMLSRQLNAENQIDVSSLPAGTHLVVVKVGNKSFSKRIIKL